MNLFRTSVSRAVILLLAAAGAAHAQTPLSTSFTYQGELASAGALASGVHDFRFRLYDAAADGNQIGSALCSDNVEVTNGRFAAILDFAAVFAGQQRYLEIEVRTDTGLDCSDDSGYTLLTPRQELTATPNANFATSAGWAASATMAADATSLSGQPASFYTNSANLTGLLNSAVLPTNVARLDGNQDFTGELSLLNPANTLSGSGSGLTNLNASNITTGMLANARTTGTNLNTASSLVLRDANGGFSAGIIIANLNGNASSATNATNLGNQSSGFYLNASNISAGTLANIRTSGNTNNIPNTLVLRDAAGSLRANVVIANLIIANLTGNATTATNATNAINATNADIATLAANANNATNATNLANQPASAYLPPTATLWAFTGLNVNNSAATLLPLYGTGRSFTAGTVVVNWSTSGFTNVASTGFQFRIRIGNNVGHWTNFFFNTGGQHTTISGTALIPVPSGTATVSLEVQRVSGAGNFIADINDSWTATLINIRQ